VHDKTKDLEAKVKELEARLKQTEAEKRELSTKVADMDAGRHAPNAEHAAKCEAIRTQAMVKDGMRFYRATVPYYREGRYFERGSVVRLPEAEQPSVTFEPLKSQAEVAPEVPARHPEPAAQPDAPKKQRASDLDV